MMSLSSAKNSFAPKFNRFKLQSQTTGNFALLVQKSEVSSNKVSEGSFSLMDKTPGTNTIFAVHERRKDENGIHKTRPNLGKYRYPDDFVIPFEVNLS
mmetsp:Transcript_21226/g.18843  ORF Transcript_21226/g.18843 Transcript_21226/m.18843 type:complete len:98 (-) Transcript_21226:48-341(-)